ncbi:hypothetical protein [Priestia megaterium]|uniref:hypothetical protein n=1 Tax=Priestia megaterium TaxID=1404 RepID=UPI001B3A1FD9|nr:hypothetical protein [Priestia megaterium]
MTAKKMGSNMAGISRSKQILKDIQKVNLRVDAFINEVKFNIYKTNREIKNGRKMIGEVKKTWMIK